MEAAAANPKAPVTDAKFGTIGAQLADILYNAWRPGGLANAVEGLSRPEVLARLLAGYDRFNVLERYGHLDVIVGENARRDVFEPALAWITQRSTR